MSNQPYAPQPTTKAKGLAVAALVLGIVAIVLAFIPIANNFSYVLGAVAIVLGIVALALKTTSKGMALTGLILGAVSIVVAIIMTMVFLAMLNGASKAVDKAVTEASASATTEHEVTYKVTADQSAKVNFDNGAGTSDDTVQPGVEWDKTVKMRGPLAPSLSVNANDLTTPGTYTCEILIDGKSVSQKSDSSLAMCQAAVQN